MAVAYVSGTFLNSGFNNVTSISINKPSSVVSGSLLVCSVNTSSASSAFTMSGWTTMISSWTDSNDSAGATFYKIAGGSEPASYTISWTTSAADGVATLLNFSGANTSTPIRTSRIDHKGATGASFTSTALTGVQSTDLTVVCGQMGDDAGSTSFTVTMPGSPWTTIDNTNESGGPKFQGNSYATGSQSGATFTSSLSTAYWNIASYAIEAAPTGTSLVPPFISQYQGRW